MIWSNSISHPNWLVNKLECLVRGLSNAPYLKMDCSSYLRPVWTTYSWTFTSNVSEWKWKRETGNKLQLIELIFHGFFNNKITDFPAHTVDQFRGYARFQRQQYSAKCCHAVNLERCFESIGWSAFRVQLAPNTVNGMAIEDFVNWCGCPCAANSLYGSALENLVFENKWKW